MNNVDNGPWSLSGVGSTNKEDNVLPAFGAADCHAERVGEF